MWGILGQDVFEFLICGEVALQFLGEFLGGDLVVGYAYGGGEALEGIAGKDGVFLLADEQADGWLLNGGVGRSLTMLTYPVTCPTSGKSNRVVLTSTTQ